MLKMDQVNENRVLTITASGTLTADDYRQLLPELEKKLDEYGQLRFYIKLEDFDGFEPGAIWEDLKFDREHADQYGRTAIIGEQKWEEWGTRFSGLFMNAEIRFFYKDQQLEAWDWVNR
ncbi:STAS/SEC14 domain-containing protein [Microbulbifer halophilus]|uniref:STAS/SEC14 domain-containing protein n=1 Tax=Microbulbifer halophilus TaxID=453963 RepID=A0ABW5ECP0_9GAMM|nr:STAS/SEC14 domain-containing protein [Microbulbifer halophilus]MCW8126541.1 STAS/SEC14 domain-containing protein [Microbulbifer halophilus]